MFLAFRIPLRRLPFTTAQKDRRWKQTQSHQKSKIKNGCLKLKGAGDRNEVSWLLSTTILNRFRWNSTTREQCHPCSQDRQGSEHILDWTTIKVRLFVGVLLQLWQKGRDPSTESSPGEADRIRELKTSFIKQNPKSKYPGKPKMSQKDINTKQQQQQKYLNKVQINGNTRNYKLVRTMRSNREMLDSTGGFWAETVNTGMNW